MEFELSLKNFTIRRAIVLIALIFLSLFFWYNYSFFDEIAFHGAASEFGSENYKYIEDYLESPNPLYLSLFNNDLFVVLFYIVGGIVSIVYLIVNLIPLLVLQSGLFVLLVSILPNEIAIVLMILTWALMVAYLNFLSHLIVKRFWSK